MAPETHFRSQPTRAAPMGVDDGGQPVVRGFSVITKGEALGHSLFVDDAFLDAVVEAGAEAESRGKRGLKSRFAHPAMLTDSIGTLLGRVKSFRRDGDQVRADLHLAESARRSPKGDLAAYLTALAKEDPEAFGASIVFTRDLAAEEAFASAHADEDSGRFRSPDSTNTHNLRHVRLKALHAADFVDDPAANPAGVFSANTEEIVAMSKPTQDAPAAPEKVKATLAELKAEYGSRPDFVVEQLESGATLLEAKTAWQAKELAETKAEAERLRSELAERAKADEVAKALREQGQVPETGAAPVGFQVGVRAERTTAFAWDNPAVIEAFQGDETSFRRYLNAESRGQVDPVALGRMQESLIAAAQRHGFAMGKAGPDYALITVKGIVGRFYKRLEEELAGSWSSKFMWLNSESNQEVETYRWLGMPPQLREWIGGRRSRGLPVNSLSITNKTFESTLEFDIEDWTFDKTGQINIRFGELAGQAAKHWEKLVTDELIANNTGYDAVALFSGSHPAADGAASNSTTYDNDVASGDIAALNVSSASAPTRDEMADIVIGLIQYIYTFLDGQSEPYNSGARKFALMVPTNMMGAAYGAIYDRLSNSGSTNTLRESLGQFEVEPIVNPRLDADSTTECYFARVDSAMKPIIGQEPVAPRLTFLGEGSDASFHENVYKGGVKAVRNVGPGQWAHILRATLS